MTAAPTAKRTALAGLVAAFIVQTVLVYSDERAEPMGEAALRGRTLWHRDGCQVCHQIYGQGGFLGPDLTNAYRRVDTVRLRTLLTVGGGQMPALSFTEAEIADMRAYLRALDRPDLGRGQLRMGSAAAGDPWQRFDDAVIRTLDSDPNPSVRRGWEAFRRRPCGACHQPLAEAPTGAPDLSHTAARLGQEELRQTLSEGRITNGMPPPTPPMTPDQMDDVVAFIDWLGGNRAALEVRLKRGGREERVDWRTLPWWEYR